jgi:hypothetical protein
MRWAVRVGALIALVYGVSVWQDWSVDQNEGPAEYRALFQEGPALVNESWRIVKMATAADIITIELEVSNMATASDVARELVDPLKARYEEVLVYVYANGEEAGDHFPAKRIQWNKADGFVETHY